MVMPQATAVNGPNPEDWRRPSDRSPGFGAPEWTSLARLRRKLPQRMEEIEFLYGG